MWTNTIPSTEEAEGVMFLWKCVEEGCEYKVQTLFSSSFSNHQELFGTKIPLGKGEILLASFHKKCKILPKSEKEA